jgi:hypothetical protein
MSMLLSLNALECGALDLWGGLLFSYGGLYSHLSGLRSKPYLMSNEKGIKGKLTQLLKEHDITYAVNSSGALLRRTVMLSELPRRVLDIIAYLPRAGVANCALISKHFSSAAWAVLYTVFDLSSIPKAAVPKLLAVLTTTQSRLDYVRTFICRAWPPSPSFRIDPRTRLTMPPLLRPSSPLCHITHAAIVRSQPVTPLCLSRAPRHLSRSISFRGEPRRAVLLVINAARSALLIISQPARHPHRFRLVERCLKPAGPVRHASLSSRSSHYIFLGPSPCSIGQFTTPTPLAAGVTC